MNELVYLKNVCDSLQVAEKFGKRHDNVLQVIDNLRETLLEIEERSEMFIIGRRKADDGQYHRMYLMNRDGFSLLVMGFTGKSALVWKLRYIKAFNQMEKFIQEKNTAAYQRADPKRMLSRNSWNMPGHRGALMQITTTPTIPGLHIKRWGLQTRQLLPGSS